MTVKHNENNDNGKFYLDNDGKEIGEMTYIIIEKNIMDINHTLIEEEHRGKNLGLELVEAGVKYAREHQLKILPTCPFVHKVFQENKNYSDVVSK